VLVLASRRNELKKSFLKTNGENRRPTIRDCIGNAMLLRERVPRSAFD
jgi:hypothetical protein